MCSKQRLNFTFTENKSTFLVLVYFVPYPDSLQFFKDKTRKKRFNISTHLQFTYNICLLQLNLSYILHCNKNDRIVHLQFYSV